MSDEIFLDGRRYVSAQSAAHDADFTRDYISRLCRDGRIAAKRIGKNWYVDQASLKQFLIEQEYSRASRSQELSRQRADEYGRHTGRTTARVESPTPVQRRSVNPTREVREKEISLSAASERERARVDGVYHKFSTALARKSEHAMRHAAALATTPAGVAEAALRASHVPAYTLTPVTEFVHRIVALTLAFALTFGTYALVDKQYAYAVAGSVQSALGALTDSYAYMTEGGFASLTQRVQSGVIIVAEQPGVALTAAASSASNSGSELLARLARTVHTSVDSFVYSIAFPQTLIASFGAGNSGAGMVSVQIEPYSLPQRISAIAGDSYATTTVVNQAVVERIKETERVVTVGGVTQSQLDDRLNQLNNKLVAQIYGITAAGGSTVPASGGFVNNIAISQRIDQLSGVDIRDSTFSGGSISGSSISATSLSVSGNTSLATTSVSGDLNVTGSLGVQNISLSSTTVTIQGTGGQTANFLDIKNASGTTVFAVQPDGTLISNISSSTQSVSQLLITGNATATNLVVLETASSSNILAVNATTTNATTTNFYASFANFASSIFDTLTATFATITNLTATNATTTNATTTNLAASNLSIFSAPIAPYFIATSSTATSTFAGGVTVSSGFYSLASSTIGDGTQAGGLSILGGATTTGDLLISKSSAPTTGFIRFGTGTPNITYNGSDYMFTGGNVYTAASSIVAQANSSIFGLGARYQANTGTYWFGATNSASPDAVFSNNAGTERVRITDAGNFGIATTTPWAKLSVVGGSSGTVIGADALSGFSGNLLDLKVASSSKFTVNQNGNLTSNGLLSFTNASTSLFSNTGTAYFGGTATTSINSTGNILGVDGTVANPAYSFSGSSNTGFYRDNLTGKVGLVIGGDEIASFYQNAATLETFGPVQAALGTVSLPSFSNRITGTTGLYFPSNSELAVTLSGTEALRVTGGNLGIGTTSPYASLAVVGGATGAGTLIAADAISGFSGNLLDLKVASTTKFSVNQAGALTLGTALTQANGGTGITSYTAGDILYADNSGNLAKLPIGANGNILQIQAGLPAWGVNAGGGGGGTGSSPWATTTLNLIYPVDTSYPVSVGSNSTSSPNSIFEVHGIQYISSKLGIATTSPVAALSVEGNGYINGGLGVGVSNTTSGTLQTSGDATVGGGLTVSSLTGSTLLYANASKLVSSASLNSSLTLTTGTLAVNMANPNVWTALQTFTNASSTLFSNIGTAYFGGTSTTTIDSTGKLTIPAAAGANVIPFASSTFATFSNGFFSQASSTIGSGSQTGGLTISGGATTTGSAYVAGKLGIGTTTQAALAVNGSDEDGNTILIGDNTNGGYLRFENNNVRNSINYASSEFGFYTSQANGFRFYTNTGGDVLTPELVVNAFGNVGIGTTTPWAKLALAGTSGQTNPLFQVASSTNSPLFTITSGGSVGIATTTPWAKLSVVGGSSGTVIGADALSGFSGNLLDLKVASSSKFTVNQNGNLTSNGLLSFTNASTSLFSNTGTAYFGASATSTFDSAGKLSLANTSNDSLLYTNGSNQVASASVGSSLTFSTGALSLNTANANSWTGLQQFANASTSIFSAYGPAYFGATATSTFSSTGALSLVSNGLTVGTDQLVVSGGNVGIGTTTPQFSLNSFSASAAQLALSAGAGIGQWAFRNAGGNLYVATTTVDGTATTTTTALTILGASGNVGIGTSSPNYLLSLSNSGAKNQLLLEDTGASADQHFFSLGTSRGIFSLNTLTDALATTTRLVVDASGNIGVGTTTPYRKLSITDTVSSAQAAIAYDATRYTELQTNSVGDFIINPQGDDAYLNDDNLWVCTGGSCPTGTPSGTGNLIVESKLGVGTSTPQWPLNILNSSGPQIALSGTGNNIWTIRESTGYLYFATSSPTTFATSSATALTITPNGSVGIGTTSPSAQLATAGALFVGNNGAGLGTATSTFYGDIKIAGKLDVSTIDPPYTIDGTKYATFVPSMTGVKEETAQVLELSKRGADGKYAYTIDFDETQKGSDLWLFYQVTDLGVSWQYLTVLLTPSFDGSVYYKKYPAEHKLVIYSDTAGEVSMRLTGNRYDFTKWPNLRADQDGDTTGTHVISSK